MSNTYDFQGKNVDHALKKASEELNTPIDKIRYEVIAYGSSGIFGLVGVKKAKIKVFVDNEKQPAQPSFDPVEKESNTIVEKEESADEKIADESQESENKDSEFFDDNLIDYGVKALQQMVDGITSDAKVHVTEKREKLYFSITGGESGVIIGKRGQTLEAIQYLLEKVINKKSSNRLRVIVDVEGYLEKRKQNLQQMASRMAEKAKRTKKPITIGQMNAHDRRIIHIHLRNENGVRTQSIGDGYFRKLMIFPKKHGNSKRKTHYTNKTNK